jgi:hypothetical protein
VVPRSEFHPLLVPRAAVLPRPPPPDARAERRGYTPASPTGNRSPAPTSTPVGARPQRRRCTLPNPTDSRAPAPTAASPAAREKQPSYTWPRSTDRSAPVPTATSPGVRPERRMHSHLIPRTVVLPRPLQRRQVPTPSGDCTWVVQRVVKPPLPLPQAPRAPVRLGPSQPLGGRANILEPEPHSHVCRQARETRCQHRRQPWPPHLREHGAVEAVQPLEHLTEKKVGQLLEQAEQQPSLPLRHERPPPRNDAPRDVFILREYRREGAGGRRCDVSFLCLLASPSWRSVLRRSDAPSRSAGVSAASRCKLVAPCSITRTRRGARCRSRQGRGGRRGSAATRGVTGGRGSGRVGLWSSVQVRGAVWLSSSQVALWGLGFRI